MTTVSCRLTKLLDPQLLESQSIAGMIDSMPHMNMPRFTYRIPKSRQRQWLMESLLNVCIVKGIA
jgi:hypothetical protein